MLNLAGRQDSLGVITGTFTCQTRTMGPHYDQYEGNFSAAPRK